MKITNLEQAVEFLRDYMPQLRSTNWNFALDDMKLVVSQLGNPQEKVKVVHVAGTSGKTSTAYYIADMLHRAGKNVGLTVSPHVDAINERVQINGQPLPEAEFCELLTEFLQLPALTNNQPSYFGIMVAFAYWVFARKGVDYAVVEVGMGGRLDATNVISNPEKVCVITDIGLDHTAMLGTTLPAIAGEKMMIIQPGNQAFMLQQADEVVAVFKERALVAKAQLDVLSPQHAPDQLPLFQQRNWSLAQQTVTYIAKRDSLNLDTIATQASADVVVPARMETLSYQGKTVIIDGAHNAQKMVALCDSIKAKYPDQKLAAVVSFGGDRDELMHEKMVALKGVVDHLIITSFGGAQDSPKQSAEPELINRAAKEAGFSSVEIETNPEKAFAKLIARPESIVLATGSFYLLNHIRPLMASTKNGDSQVKLN